MIHHRISFFQKNPTNFPENLTGNNKPLLSIRW